MWNKLKLLLIILSLTLNIAFLVSWVEYRFRVSSLCTAGETPSEVTLTQGCPLHSKLCVTKEQSQQLEPEFAKFRQQHREICRKVGNNRREIIELLASADPNLQTIRLKQEEIITCQRKMQDLVIEQLQLQKHVLTSEQQKMLFELIAKLDGCASHQERR